jgi:hypothetical protein
MPRYVFKCPVCDRKIVSEYKEQLEANALNHMYAHLRKGEVTTVDINEIRMHITQIGE